MNGGQSATAAGKTLQTSPTPVHPHRSRLCSRLACLGVLLCCLCGSIDATPADPVQSGARPLRVATGVLEPFVIKQDKRLTGFSIDLWDALARRLQLEYSWVEYPWASSDEQLRAVQSGEVDAAISKLVMTPEREAMVDFCHPYLDSGLKIMVRAQNDRPVLTAMLSLVSSNVWPFLAAAILIVFLLAQVFWLVERRSNPDSQKGYIRGVLEGLWGVYLLIATGENSDRNAPGVARRLMVALIWLIGVVLVAQFTATVTASLTLQQLRSSIEGPGDLPGKTIATVPASIAARYLQQRGLPYSEISSSEEGVAMLIDGRIQALVFDAPSLQYWAARRGQGALRVVGPIFGPEKYGIALAQKNPLRKRINEALLAMYADGEYEQIHNRWFSPGS